MSIGNAHSYADSNTIGDIDANRDTYCDANTDSTATDTHTNGNSNGHTNSNGYCNRYRYSNSNAYCESNPWEYMLSANDGEPCFCSKHAVEFYGSGERDRCDLKDNFKRRSRCQRKRIRHWLLLGRSGHNQTQMGSGTLQRSDRRTYRLGKNPNALK